MSKLKNIIFDLGGVLIDLDFSRTTNAFERLGFPHFENMFSQYKVDELFAKLETGKISREEFYGIISNIGKRGITTTEIEKAWNELLLDFRIESLNFLKEIKKEYSIFLLSNTNVIHYDAFNTILKKQTGFEKLDPFFTKSYYSHLIGLRKPNNDIFDFVLEDAGIKETETLFIDDTRDNVLAAQQMGFKTHLLLPAEKIESLDWSIIKTRS